VLKFRNINLIATYKHQPSELKIFQFTAEKSSAFMKIFQLRFLKNYLNILKSTIGTALVVAPSGIFFNSEVY
jgi:hypothetical protein